MTNPINCRYYSYKILAGAYEPELHNYACGSGFFKKGVGMMPSGNKIFTVDKFLGLNESGDGSTELKMGESPKMVNFYITDGFNLTVRPGFLRLDIKQNRDPAPVAASWSGYVGENQYLVIVDIKSGVDRIWMYGKDERRGFFLHHSETGVLGVSNLETAFVKVFSFAGKLYIMSTGRTVVYDGEKFVDAAVYVPTVITSRGPTGGGDTLENLNMLSPLRRIEFSADGTAKEYLLPEEATTIEKIVIDNVEKPVQDAGAWDVGKHTFTFSEAPIKGVSNVEVTYGTDQAKTEETRKRLAKMRLTETYNGSTDTRIFFAGDGTNICFYSGVPLHGDLSQLYFPSMNEVAVDMSDSPVTGLVRHYSKLLVFKPDGAFTITYEPVTLPGGNTIAGFYLRPANREIGSDIMGQIQTVDNRPRTIAKSGIYEWQITSSYYQDERNAHKISEKVGRTLRKADYEKIITCDDTRNGTYYVFLNDWDGTVLVNRYLISREGVWFTYKSSLCKNVSAAMVIGEDVVFIANDEPFYFSNDATKDAPEKKNLSPKADESSVPISARWESGFMSFGADFIRKYSSLIYVSVQPKSKTELTITAETDKRSKYLEKEIIRSMFSFSNMDFSKFTFNTNATPRIDRIRLKVKKFVYYKLIFEVNEPGAQATILGYDQQIRYASYAK